MQRIQSTSSKDMPYPATEVWKVIADLGNYPTWWPRSTKVKVLHVAKELIGSRLEIRPYGGQAFVCEVCGITPGRTLRMAYSGIYSGNGAWDLTDTNGHTRLGYSIDLQIDSAFIRFLARFLPVTAMHAKLTEQILDGLAQHLHHTHTQ